MEAMSLHRLLGTDLQEGGFKCGQDSPLSCELPVIGERGLARYRADACNPTALSPGTSLLLVATAAGVR